MLAKAAGSVSPALVSTLVVGDRVSRYLSQKLHHPTGWNRRELTRRAWLNAITSQHAGFKIALRTGSTYPILSNKDFRGGWWRTCSSTKRPDLFGSPPPWHLGSRPRFPAGTCRYPRRVSPATDEPIFRQCWAGRSKTTKLEDARHKHHCEPPLITACCCNSMLSTIARRGALVTMSLPAPIIMSGRANTCIGMANASE